MNFKKWTQWEPSVVGAKSNVHEKTERVQTTCEKIETISNQLIYIYSYIHRNRDIQLSKITYFQGKLFPAFAIMAQTPFQEAVPDHLNLRCPNLHWPCSIVFFVLFSWDFSLLWWLIWCVIWTRLRDAQIASKILFWGASVRVFPKEIVHWIGRLSKEDGPRQCKWVPSNPLRAWIAKKGGERANLLFLLELERPSSVLGH